MSPKGFARVALSFGFAATLAAAGCGGEAEEIDEVQGNALSANALTANALTANALTANALTANALTANALTANALTANALTANGLRDPLSRQFLKYVVSCALDEDQSISMVIDGQRYTFQGSLGVAPEWGSRHGSCDEECQRWVSGCVLARVDAAGVERLISVRGANEGLDTDAREQRAYPVREATYFGNLFVEGQPRFMCLSPSQRSNERVCGASLDDCPMEVVGSCSRACSGEDRDGAFRNCSSSGKARRPEVYRESVTVFLPK
jgi:hypothetical protein